jgi:6-phosphogluconate dehydrogenase
MDALRPFAIIGLGKMGANLARHALDRGLGVAGFTKGDPPADLVRLGMQPVSDTAALKRMLQPPRIVFLYVPAGPIVDEVIGDLDTVLEKGDIIVDGGNSYWRDSIRRHAAARDRGLHFLDLGTSGGISGARRGACFMVGGESAPVAIIEPILRRLAVTNGYVHAGPPGAGHFVKLVHNGIEFGMLEAIAEGMDMLARFEAPLPIDAVLRCWRHGSVIRSWLLDLMEEGFRREGGLGGIPPFVEDTGEVNWLVGDALHFEVAIPVIAQAVMRLIESRDGTENWARAIALMRHGFGGHPFGADKAIARERHEGRVGDADER